MLGRNFWKVFVALVLITGLMTTTRQAQAQPPSANGCPDALTRLNPGDIAVVSEEGGPSGLNLRVQPGLDQEIILSIPLSAQVTIISGPKCKGGYRWYELGYQGHDGWSAEVGPDGNYNLNPNNPSKSNSNTNEGSQYNSEGSMGACGYDPGFCPSGSCAPQIYEFPTGPDLFIVASCQVRRIPNTDTLRALGIPVGVDAVPGESINNIPKGPDVPDVIQNPEGFCQFKNINFPDVTPGVGAYNCVNANLSPTIWPVSLIGEWKGTIRSPNCNNVSCDTNMDATITRGPDGRLTDIEANVLNPSTYEQEVYKEIQTLDGASNFYYCFRWTGTDIYVVEDCFRVIDNNQVSLVYFGGKFGIEGASVGVLTRVSEPSVTPTTQSTSGCEPTNGKPAYGIINIGPDVFVIVCGERRLVPNPTTLDALGISRNMIDNMGMSDTQLSAIPRGPDIPDITRDPLGFQVFKRIYDQFVAPSLGKQPGQNPIIPAPIQPEPTSAPFLGVNWCNVPLVNLFACPPEVQASDVNTTCSDQCVATAHKNRPDLDIWAKGAGTSDNILAIAQKEKPFLYNGQTMQVRVRSSDSDPNYGPEARDLVIWPSNCGYAWSGGGHIGYVDYVKNGKIAVIDSNWTPTTGPVCTSRNDVEIDVLSCMKFVTYPYLPVNEFTSPPDTCNRYSGLNWLLCKVGFK